MPEFRLLSRRQRAAGATLGLLDVGSDPEVAQADFAFSDCAILPLQQPAHGGVLAAIQRDLRLEQRNPLVPGDCRRQGFYELVECGITLVARKELANLDRQVRVVATKRRGPRRARAARPGSGGPGRCPSTPVMTRNIRLLSRHRPVPAPRRPGANGAATLLRGPVPILATHASNRPKH